MAESIDIGDADVGALADRDPKSDVLVLLACSKSKAEGELPAREKYAGKRAHLFQKSRDYAEAIDADYLVLSGKFGVLAPDVEIGDYDVSVRDRDADRWAAQVRAALQEVDVERWAEVMILAGQDYREPIQEWLHARSVDVTAPLADCSGNGEMMSRLDEWLADLESEQDDSVDPTDPSVYEIDQSVDNDPDGPDVAGWELEQIVYDTPTWVGPDGDRVKVVKQADKYPLFARDEPIKHGSLDRADSITKAVEWMRAHPVTDDDREVSADDSEVRPDDDVLDYDDLGEFQAERIVRQIAEHESVAGIEAFISDDDVLSLPSAEAVPLAHAVQELGDDRAVEVASDVWECGSCFGSIEQRENAQKGLCQDCRDEIQSWSGEDTDTMTDQTELSESTDDDREASADGGDERDETTIEDLARERSNLRHDLDEVGAGVIARKDNHAYWLHEDALDRSLADLTLSLRDQLERGRGLPYMAREIVGVEAFESKRAPAFLRALADQLGAKAYNLEYRPDVANATLARHADVPVWIVAEGKYSVAAWLAAHGFDNSSIANALDVSESTITVNLSKFKNGYL